MTAAPSEVPDDLVEERRVEERALGEAGGERRVVGLDLEAPGQVGRQAEELVVEPVAEPADGLRDEQAGRERVGERPEADAGEAAADDDADRRRR